MPYISIKAQPKDPEAVKVVVDRINQVIMEEFGCPSNVISIAYEEFTPDQWDNQVFPEEVLTNKENMRILLGEKLK